jgi:ferric-dicitrate binding protein FerR (iron transport regulator)
VHTPKGRQFSLLLPDGTQVWLNAASSIRYPTTFTEGQRRVEVSGEVYFEIARNTKMPFRASVNNKAEVEVLGTHFNVNAYENEEYINTTLLEGSIKVQAGGAAQPGNNDSSQVASPDRPDPHPAQPSSVILKPGQQALMQVGETTQPAMKAQPGITVVDADIDQVMAWKNGAFNFNGASLEEVMRQLERWYDIEVIYEKGVPDIRIGGELSRDVSLAGLLKGLKESKVRFRIEEGHRLVVLP